MFITSHHNINKQETDNKLTKFTTVKKKTQNNHNVHNNNVHKNITVKAYHHLHPSFLLGQTEAP